MWSFRSPEGWKPGLPVAAESMPSNPRERRSSASTKASLARRILLVDPIPQETQAAASTAQGLLLDEPLHDHPPKNHGVGSYSGGSFHTARVTSTREAIGNFDRSSPNNGSERRGVCLAGLSAADFRSWDKPPILVERWWRLAASPSEGPSFPLMRNVCTKASARPPAEFCGAQLHLARRRPLRHLDLRPTRRSTCLGRHPAGR